MDNSDDHTMQQATRRFFNAIQGICEPTDRLEALRVMRGRIAAEERAMVQLARDEDATWQEIAAALGVTRQAAHERFSGSGA